MEATDCPKIDGLILDKKSIEAIEQIKAMREVKGHLPLFLVSGVFANIFIGNNTLKIAYNINETDWELLAAAMQSFPSYAKSRIYSVAAEMAIYYEFHNNHRMIIFWRAIANGCSI